MKALALIVMIFSFSCIKQVEEQNYAPKAIYQEKIETYKTFSFKTKEKVNLYGSWKLINGNFANNIRLKIYSGDENKYLTSVMTDSNGYYSIDIELPTSEKKIFLESDYIGAEKGIWIKL